MGLAAVLGPFRVVEQAAVQPPQPVLWAVPVQRGGIDAAPHRVRKPLGLGEIRRLLPWLD